jgi:hypothetical protein
MSSAILLDRLLTRPCTVHVRSEGPPDADGVASVTVATVDTRCYAEQASASEPGAEPQWTVQDWKVVLATVDGLGLDGWDRVDIGDEPYEVTGGPWPVRDPHDDVVHHVELRARRAEANTDG